MVARHDPAHTAVGQLQPIFIGTIASGRADMRDRGLHAGQIVRMDTPHHVRQRNAACHMLGAEAIKRGKLAIALEAIVREIIGPHPDPIHRLQHHPRARFGREQLLMLASLLGNVAGVGVESVAEQRGLPSKGAIVAGLRPQALFEPVGSAGCGDPRDLGGTAPRVFGMAQPLRIAAQYVFGGPPQRAFPSRVHRQPSPIVRGDSQQILAHLPQPVALGGPRGDFACQIGVQSPQLLDRPYARDRIPAEFGNFLDQRDLVAGPIAGLGMAEVEAPLPFASAQQRHRDPGFAADQGQRIGRRRIAVIRRAETDRLACPHGSIPARAKNGSRNRPSKRRQCSANPTRPILNDVILGDIEEARPIDPQIAAQRFRSQVHDVVGIAFDPLPFDQVQYEIPLGFRRDQGAFVQHLGGHLQPLVEDAVGDPVLVQNRRTVIAPEGLGRHTAAHHHQTLGDVRDPLRRRQRLAKLRPEHRPDIGTRLRCGTAQSPRMVVRQHRPRIVVEQPKVRAPVDRGGKTGTQAEPDAELQGSRPILRGPERVRGPVEIPQ
ncbi:hypothetical protein D9M73_102030 [compost metagenome]